MIGMKVESSILESGTQSDDSRILKVHKVALFPSFPSLFLKNTTYKIKKYVIYLKKNDVNGEMPPHYE